MGNYYLRVEAVNLSGFVCDTQDLSTIRGGGLLLLDMIEQLKVLGYLKPITTGASAGLFEFHDRDPEEVRNRIESIVRVDLALKHATFVVDVWPASSPDGWDNSAHGGNSPFIADRERLIAANRWRQMRKPSLAVPAWNKEGLPVCSKDRVRPAPETMENPDPPGPRLLPISVSVQQRRDFGIREKSKLYERLTGIEAEYTFEFGELTGMDRDDPNYKWIPSNLHDKMAVIHIDGNKFGKIQDRTATSATDQTLFDQLLKTKYDGILKSLLEDIGKDSTWQTTQGRNRLETLLWGGDERCWVVPAWKGWEMLRRFFESTTGWQTQRTESPEALTHAAGLVFCHKNAPIHRIRGLAEELTKQAKEGRPMENAFAYAVLETFDHISEGIENYWDKRRPQPPALETEAERTEMQRGWVLPSKSMKDIQEVVLGLKRGDRFPRRKLYQIVREWLGDPEQARRTIDATWNGLPEGAAREDSSSEKLRASFDEAFGPTDLRWFHLIELWDYIPDTIKG